MILLKLWIQKIQILRRSFVEIFFRHISICFNDTADISSKEVVSFNFGSARVQEFVEGAMTFEREFDLKELMY